MTHSNKNIVHLAKFITFFKIFLATLCPVIIPEPVHMVYLRFESDIDLLYQSTYCLHEYPQKQTYTDAHTDLVDKAI